MIFSDNDNSKDYCLAGGGCDEYIGNVAFGDINNTSDCTEYGDYTDQSTDISVGETIPITVTNGNTWDGDICGIWIDWNQNDDFSDDEPINVSSGPDVFTASISPPDDAIGGTTRIRIRIQYYGLPEPCGTTSYGEVEDYSLNVITWLSLTPKLGIVLPVETVQAEVSFDATGLDIGDYTAEFTIGSDDPDQPEVIIPVTLHVAEFAVVASADPSEPCYGEEVQLDVNVSGGLGSYAYTWTSDPPGFNSTLKSPVVVPMENTSYLVQASDGVDTGFGEVSVSVHDYPEVSIGADTSICMGEEIIFDAGPDHLNYEWQDGCTDQTFTASESGLYWVEVNNVYGCVSRDSVTLTVQESAVQPAKPAGPAFVDLYEGSLTTYETSTIPEVLEYSWEIIPEEAAEIVNNGPEATIEWDTTFIGQAQLKVMATNMCGTSPWSDSLQITVVNTTGTAELEKNLGLEIYPNPNQGTFNIVFSTLQEMYINIYIISQQGSIVYRKENKHLNGHFSEQINLGHLVAGVYTVTVENKADRIYRKVVVKE